MGVGIAMLAELAAEVVERCWDVTTPSSTVSESHAIVGPDSALPRNGLWTITASDGVDAG